MDNKLIVDLSTNEVVEELLTQEEMDTRILASSTLEQERVNAEVERGRIEQLEVENAQLRLDMADVQLALAELFTA